MTTDETDFDKVFKKYGGLFDANVMPFLVDLRTMMYERVNILRIKYPRLPFIYINYVSSNKVNARIAKCDDKYYLGINVGAYFLMRDMFTRMLSHKTILPEIGNPTNEMDVPDYLLSSLEDGELSFVTDFKAFSFPKDTVRNIVADHFTFLAFDFLLHHECCHVLRGHLSYVTQTAQESCLHENNHKVAGSLIPSDILQALEMDADSFALNRMLNFFRSAYEGHMQVSDELRFMYKDHESIIATITFITYSFFRLFGHNQPKSNEIMLYDHPPISIRMIMVATNAVSILHPVANEISRKLNTIVISKIREAEKAFLTITPQNTLWNEYTYPNRVATPYMHMLDAKWKEIRPTLWSHKYSDTLPE